LSTGQVLSLPFIIIGAGWVIWAITTKRRENK